MAELMVLGTAASVPDADHDTVSLALSTREGCILVDCGGSPLYKLARLGVHQQDIRAVILTHRHADHMYGLPMLVQGLWLGGREVPLPVYGPGQALERGRELLSLFELAVREDMFSLAWIPVPLRERHHILQLGPVVIESAPVQHGNNDTLALRFENRETEKSIVYSADTEPCEGLIRLAMGTDLLLHEASGELAGHSSPEQAAELAREAGVSRLALIHYPIPGTDLEAWRRRASEFPGPVILAKDDDIFPL